jgi:hypothetical protein
MTFRRLFAITLLTVCCGSAVILGLFLYRLDIDLYRPEIEQELVRRTNLPLSLGKIEFSLKHGPAVAFDALQVGRPDLPLQINAKRLYLRLRFLPMLQGQLAFSEILLEEPDIRIQAIPAAEAATPDHPTAAMPTGDMFQSIRIHKGRLRYEDANKAGQPFVFGIEHLELSIKDLSFRSANAMTISGDLLCNNVRSPLLARGTIQPSQTDPGWRHATYDLELSVRDLASDLISGYLRRSPNEALIRGRSNITLQLSGIPETGIRITARAAGRDLGLHLPGPTATILQFGQINLSTTWKMTQARHIFDALWIKIADLELNGQVILDRSGPLPRISAHLASPAMPLAALEQMLPFAADRDRSPANIIGGRLTLQSLELDGTLDQIAGSEFPAGIRKLMVSATDVDLKLGDSRRITNGGFTLTWDGKTADISRLQGRLNDLMIGLTGNVTPTGSIARGFNLDSAGRLFLVAPAVQKPTPFLPETLNVPYRLMLSATATDHRELQLTLELPEAPLALDIQWLKPEQHAEKVTVAVKEIAIGALTNLSPLLQRWSLGGLITANLTLERSESGWQPTATLRLREASTPIPGPLPVLHTINGRIDIDGRSLHGNGVEAILGTSPIRVNVEIPDLLNPVTSLYVTAPEIRASDLIFTSTTSMLQEVDGMVRISSQQVGLGPIHVSLPGGTTASVDGHVSLPEGDVDLTINGLYGNIDEVIALWSDDAQQGTETVNIPDEPLSRPTAAPVAPSAQTHGRLTLSVSAEQGEIAGMPFSDATAQIERHGSTLVISPIHFRSGPGQGLGQALLVHRDQGPPLLKISGNLKGFNAPVIHQQLLKRKSVISGKLDADFYLEGIVGHSFLPTSFGAAVVQLRNGNLHKISWLSKVLTILNIYPLLTRGDSDLGLPYDKVNGNLVLRKGVLSSEDIVLKGDVMNLSLVGNANLITNQTDTTLEAMPLRSVDRILTHIPVAGWLLTGEKKALIVAHFRMSGPSDDPVVEAIPLESVSAPVIGIFKRLIGLPVKLVTDPGGLLQNN